MRAEPPFFGGCDCLNYRVNCPRYLNSDPPREWWALRQDGLILRKVNTWGLSLNTE